MEKGIVVEPRGSKAIVLTLEGEFKKVPVSRDKYEVGQEIEFRTARTISTYKFGAIAAVIILALIIPLIVNFMEIDNRAYAYVQLDINPSVEFTVNKHSKIIGVRGLNSDGDKVLEGADLEGKDMEDGLRYFTTKSYELGYTGKEDKNHIIVTTVMESENNKSVEEKIEKKAEDAVNEAIQEKGIPARVSVLKATNEIKEEADKAGVSSGKYLLVLEASSEGVDIDIEDVRDISITAVLEKSGGDVDRIVKEAHKTREEMEQLLEKYREKAMKQVQEQLKKEKEKIKAAEDKRKEKGQSKDEDNEDEDARGKGQKGNILDEIKKIKEDMEDLREEKIKEEIKEKRQKIKEEIREKIRDNSIEGDDDREKDVPGKGHGRDDDVEDDEEQDEDDDLDDEDRSGRDKDDERGNRSGNGKKGKETSMAEEIITSLFE